MRIVLVHDYLNQRGGAERVVGAMHRMFPDAEIYTLFVDDASLWDSLKDARIVPSFLQRFPFIRKHFKLFFWLYPFAMRTLRLPDCDVVLSSSSAYAKGIRIQTRSGNRPVHVCYCHNPMRFAWDFQSYMAHEGKNKLVVSGARKLVPLLKKWDLKTSDTVDLFIANSSTVQDRIRRIYGRSSEVVFPPVEIPSVQAATTQAEDYFLVVSRLVSYKRIDLAVRACTRLNRRLVVIGTGPDRARLMGLAGPNVEFLGYQPDATVRHYMQRCKALIFPGEEDFGITPVEVGGHGRPVVAYQGGGALDTIVDGVNGLFFDRPTVQSLKEALLRVDSFHWDSEAIRHLARRFDTASFEQHLAALVWQAANRVTSLPAQAKEIEMIGGFGG